MPSPVPLLLLALGWIAYFIVHSLLASLRVKRRIEARRPAWMPAYRLFFNLSAVLLILPLLWFTFSLGGDPLGRWHGPWRWLAEGLALLAMVGFLWSARYYDNGEFLGTPQWRERETRVEDQEHLHVSPPHRFVRHPWYFFGLVLMWTRDMDPALLTTVTLATLYFIFGSRLEERKLLHYYGEAYARYRQRVPGLLPLPWRHLSAADARELEQLAAAHRPGNPAQLANTDPAANGHHPRKAAP